MSKLDKAISNFFDSLRQGVKTRFAKDILKNPEAREAVKQLQKAEDVLLKYVKKEYSKS
tara:strand:- start:1277 stop:1453 length:177 start_codon:yes stop_codon:yes gene_type:complete